MSQDQIIILAFSFSGLVLSEYVQLISDRGSFLNSLWGRSQCDSCKTTIPWFGLIPLLGRFLLKGSCPTCGKHVSWKYFQFEVIFGLGWIASLAFFYINSITSPLILAVYLLLYCTSWLLMYEDGKHYSVPVSWLISWGITYVLAWFFTSSTHQVYPPDTLLMAATLGLALVSVALRKPKEERSISQLFGAADFIVLFLFVLLLGFQYTTVILVLTMINAVLYLLMRKQLKAGQRLPLLTVMLPWGYLLLFLLF